MIMPALRKALLRVLLSIGLAGTVFIAALVISAKLDPVPSRTFTHSDGTYDHYVGWDNDQLLQMYPDGRTRRQVIDPIPVMITSNEWANLYIVYMLGLGSIHGVSGEAYIIDREGICLWRHEFHGMLGDLFTYNCWWLQLADVDGDGRAEVVVTFEDNEEYICWSNERALRTAGRHQLIERLDGKQTPVDVKTLPRWRRIRFWL